MTSLGRKIGLALTAVAVPAMLAAPISSAQAGGFHHRGHYYRDYGHHHHRHRGGGGNDLAVGLLGAGIGLVIGSAIASNNHRSDRVVVRERVVTREPAWRDPDYYGRDYGYRNYGSSSGWYQPVAQRQPAPRQPADSSCLQTREYQTRITVGGREVDAYGTACLQPDGAWKYGAPTPEPY